jgi:hypothetical protein
MSHFVRRITAVLMPETGAQRAIQETLADWREDAAGSTGARRVAAHARGVVSVARVAAGLLLDQFTSFRLWRSFGLTLAVTLASAVVCSALVTWTLYGSGKPPSSAVSPALFGLMLISSWTLSLFAIVASLGLGTQDRSPVAGMFVLCFLFSAAMVGVIVPAVSDGYVSQLARDLPAASMAPRFSWSPAAQYASLWWVSTLFLMGETIRRRMPHRTWRARQVWALLGAAAITAVAFMASLPVLLSTTMSIGERVGWIEGVLWSHFAIAWVAIVLIARRIPVERSAYSPIVRS